MKRILSILLSLLFVIGLVGCSSHPVSTATTSSVGSGILNLYNIDPQTLDPAISGEGTSNGYVLQIFSGLVRLDDKLEPVPDIAQDWQISPDGKSYTFHLRQDVYFQNGRKVQAQDFKYSWERACNPATGSQTASTYMGDIQGVKGMLAGQSQSLSGVEVINDYTLKVSLDSPKSYFLAKLTYPTGFVVDKDNVAKGSSWWRQPNGSGPFKLKSWQQGSQLVLERNARYYGERAQLNSVVFHILSGIPMNLYEQNKIDVAEVDVSNYDKVTDKSGPFYNQLSIFPELSLMYIGFNCTKPPFDDANIRRAFTLVLNKERLASLIYRGTVQLAYGILPPGMPGFNEWLIGQSYDVKKASELIAASKYGRVENLPTITITTQGWGGNIGDLEAIVYEWKTTLGVDVEVRQLDPMDFTYNIRQEKDEMFYWGWSADYAHPQNFLEVLFASGAGYNTGEYSNPQFDALLQQASREQNEASSFKLYQQAEQILVNDAACLPLWSSKSYLLVKPYVKGYAPNPLGTVMLNKVSIQK